MKGNSSSIPECVRGHMLSKLLLPYCFKGLKVGQMDQFRLSLTQKSVVMQYLGSGIYEQMSSIYTNVLSAVADNDQEYLKNVMEPNLYATVVKGLKQISDEKLHLEYIEQEGLGAAEGEEWSEQTDSGSAGDGSAFVNSAFQATATMQNKLFCYKKKDMDIIVQTQGVLGVDIHRSLSASDRLMRFSFTPRMVYYLNLAQPRNLFQKKILALDIYFSTTRKLVLKNEQNELTEEMEKNPEKVPDMHMWRLETYVPKFDWILTDMDMFLKGNPYAKSAQK